MRAAWNYYWRWLKVASIGDAWGRAGNVASAIVAIAAAISWIVWKATDNPVSQTATGITIVIFLLISFARLFAAPYWMYQEDEAKRRNSQEKEDKKRSELEDELEAGRLRMEASLEHRRQREEQEQCLAELLDEGMRLKGCTVDNLDRMRDWSQDYNKWRERIRGEVGRRFSPAIASRFFSLPAPIDRSVVAFDGIHQNALAWISAAIQEMHEISRAISAKD